MFSRLFRKIFKRFMSSTDNQIGPSVEPRAHQSKFVHFLKETDGSDPERLCEFNAKVACDCARIINRRLLINKPTVCMVLRLT